MSDFRQAAIDAILEDLAFDSVKELRAYVSKNKQDDYFYGGILYAINAVQDLPPAQPEIIRCKDCRFFEYDHPYIVQGVPVLGHLVCTKWGDGCRTAEDGFCFMAERRTDENN